MHNRLCPAARSTARRTRCSCSRSSRCTPWGQKYVTTWGYVADPLIFVVNKDIWNSWTPADQKIVRDAAIEAGKQEIAIARKGLVEADKPLLKDIAAMGVTVTALTPAEREAFVKATRPVYDKWKATIGPDLVKTAEAAIAARKK
jgi:TRAP-type C4-dicarboxylate transport system substrate-binding protein